MPQWFQRVFVVNGSLKLIAFVLTLALFIWVREDRESAVTGYVPVSPVIPEGMVLVSDPVERVRVTVGGRWTDLNKFDPSQLQTIRLNVEEDTSGLVSITADMIKLPPGLRVTSIQPNYVRVELEPAASHSVPIRPRIAGEPAESFDLGDVAVRPPRIQVTGPESSVENLEYVWTEPVDVTDRTESFEKRVNLRIDDPYVQYDVDRIITVKVPIDTQEVTRTLQDVGVVAVNTTHETDIRPETISVTVRGPKPIIDRMSGETIYAAIDLAAEDDKPPGTFSKPARIANLPPEVNLVAFHPTEFVVTTRRAPPDTNPDQE
jgi:YbbR domain-containing protein